MNYVYGFSKSGMVQIYNTETNSITELSEYSVLNNKYIKNIHRGKSTIKVIPYQYKHNSTVSRLKELGNIEVVINDGELKYISNSNQYKLVVDISTEINSLGYFCFSGVNETHKTVFYLADHLFDDIENKLSPNYIYNITKCSKENKDRIKKIKYIQHIDGV